MCRAEVTQSLSSNWLENSPEGDHFVGSYGRVFDVIVLGRPGPIRRLADDHTRSWLV